MARRKRTSVADVLTWTRLVSIVPITAAIHAEARGVALVLYLVAIATDALDGLAARLQRTASRAGAEFDGAVDLAFAAATLWWLWLLTPELYAQYWPAVLIVGALFALYFAVSQRFAGRPLMLHLWSGKLAMLLFALLLPLTLLFGIVAWYVHATWIAAAASRAEAIVCVTRGRRALNARSAFF